MADAGTPWADFHLHSTCSDGADAPEAVAGHAAALGARALALTDHDTTAGNAAAAAAAQRLGLDYLPGVEISTVFERADVHVIALGIAPGHAELEDALGWLRAARARRGTAIVERLLELGIDLSDVLPTGDTAEGASVGRMHVATALAAKGIVKRPQDAFDRFLNPGKPAFVPRLKLETARALDLIHAAGGLAFVAHPGLNNGLRKLLQKLLLLPFDGLEAYHISHTPGRQAEFCEMATARGLLISGGSDCHGGVKGRREMGRVRLPWRHVEALRARLGQTK